MGKHIHKYRRVNIGHDGKKFWVMRCVKPGCSHYMAMSSKLSCPILKDSIAECNRCDDRFILDKRALRMEKPCCEDCIRKKENKKLDAAEEFFQELQKELMK
jgi:hypothetical protein